jgi:hypothetical protein
LTGLACAGDAPGLRWGFDERIRQDVFNHIPVRLDPPGEARYGMNNYLRFRTRVWLEADPAERLTLRARAVEEFRLYRYPEPKPEAQRANYQFPDELVFDNLWLEARDLAGGLWDVRVGRQDLRYGNGRILSDGTPKDGSRTTYFDALKVTWKGWTDLKLDLLGLYNPPLDKLAIHSADRDLTGYTSSANDDHITDSGAGAYLMVNRWTDCPLEFYGFYQHQTAWEQSAPKDKEGRYLPAAAGQVLDEARGLLENGALDRGTCGFRVVPQFSKQLTGTLEAAIQFGQKGDADILACLVDVGVTNQLPVLREFKPAVFVSLYFLSGSAPGSGRLSGWHPPWARDSQDSRITSFIFDTEGYYEWSNLLRPTVGLQCTPHPRLTTLVTGSYLAAPEADGSGGGHERGWLGQFNGDFVLAEGLFDRHDKLTGVLLLQVLKPGDYYDANPTAYAFRWQLKYDF